MCFRRECVVRLDISPLCVSMAKCNLVRSPTAQANILKKLARRCPWNLWSCSFPDVSASFHRTMLPRRLCCSVILSNSTDFREFSKFSVKCKDHVGHEMSHRPAQFIDTMSKTFRTSSGLFESSRQQFVNLVAQKCTVFKISHTT